jgi:hypothetical protein
MFIATFVRCLSYLKNIYIGFQYQHYRIYRVQNEQILHDINRLLKDYMKCIARISSCQIYDLQTITDSLNIFDIHTAQ